MLTVFLLVVAGQNVSPGAVLLDRTGTGTLNALNATCSVSLAAQVGVGAQIAVGTLVGIVVPEVSYDNGTTWVSTFFDDPSGNKSTSIAVVGPTTAITQTIIGAGGISNARVRVSSFTSGTAACTLRASAAGDPSLLAGGNVNTTTGTRPPTGMQLGGYDVLSGLFSAPETKPPGTAAQGGEAGLVVTGVELVRIRQLLEQLVELEKANADTLRSIKDPGPASPTGRTP